MSVVEYLIDTNILIYHTKGLKSVSNFISEIIAKQAFNLSILTKIEFLGWNKHSSEGFEKCRRLIELANVYTVDEDIAEQAIELKRQSKIRLADAVIAATAIVNNFKLVTRNVDDYKAVKGLEIFNPFG
jgi:predicted nucleic acid-binding protein